MRGLDRVKQVLLVEKGRGVCRSQSRNKKQRQKDYQKECRQRVSCHRDISVSFTPFLWWRVQNRLYRSDQKEWLDKIQTH